MKEEPLRWGGSEIAGLLSSFVGSFWLPADTYMQGERLIYIKHVHFINCCYAQKPHKQ